MKLMRHGYSCIELHVDGTRVLFDPGTFSSFDDVSGVDAVVVTRQHADHLDSQRLDLLRRHNPAAVWFADPQTAAQLAEKGSEATPTRPVDDVRRQERPVGGRRRATRVPPG